MNIKYEFLFRKNLKQILLELLFVRYDTFMFLVTHGCSTALVLLYLRLAESSILGWPQFLWSTWNGPNSNPSALLVIRLVARNFQFNADQFGPNDRIMLFFFFFLKTKK